MLAVESPTGDMAREMRYTFPGRTATLAAVLKDMQAEQQRDVRTGEMRKAAGGAAGANSDDRGPLVNSFIAEIAEIAEKNP